MLGVLRTSYKLEGLALKSSGSYAEILFTSLFISQFRKYFVKESPVKSDNKPRALRISALVSGEPQREPRHSLKPRPEICVAD